MNRSSNSKLGRALSTILSCSLGNCVLSKTKAFCCSNVPRSSICSPLYIFVLIYFDNSMEFFFTCWHRRWHFSMAVSKCPSASVEAGLMFDGVFPSFKGSNRFPSNAKCAQSCGISTESFFSHSS